MTTAFLLTTRTATSVPAAAAAAFRALAISSLRHRLPPSLSVLTPFSIPATSKSFPGNRVCTPNPRRTRVCAAQSNSSAGAVDLSASAASPGQPQRFAVLFVCLGNICRSPAAEGVFRSLVSKKGLDAHFKIDSAGTIGYHEGDPADPRMRGASKRRGIEITSISRPLRPSDFRDFDLILAMDLQNKDDILSAYERWRFKEPLPEDAPKKVKKFIHVKLKCHPQLRDKHGSEVKLMCSYCKKYEETEVPDPYYDGPQGFEKVLDLLEDACDSLLNSILAENSHISSS
ncbi:hypothetical protein Taro_049780 [Colocasia esculenta]|uniref:acid phosphatase n=1 Tax=Colocasia esculenta TaxID=4460 RepID=A0A843XBW5_COLES|nr:hypothetical protein [Colocasia esculenta]